MYLHILEIYVNYCKLIEILFLYLLHIYVFVYLCLFLSKCNIFITFYSKIYWLEIVQLFSRAKARYLTIFFDILKSFENLLFFDLRNTFKIVLIFSIKLLMKWLIILILLLWACYLMMHYFYYSLYTALLYFIFVQWC